MGLRSPSTGRTLRPPVAVMTGKPVPAWPSLGNYRYEPKWDGWRCVAFSLEDGVYLQSRHGRDLTPYFPDVAAAAQRRLPTGTVIDGELVIWSGDRTDFTLLQRRITNKASQHAPANLVVFDLLQHPALGVIAHRPLVNRRELLEELLHDAPSTFTLCPQSASRTVADDWLDNWAAAIVGIEGCMIKHAAGTYRFGRVGWLKRRHYDSVDLLIGGITGSLSQPRSRQPRTPDIRRRDPSAKRQPERRGSGEPFRD